jgi:hypothetical protein
MKIDNIDSKIVLTKNLFEETFQKLTYLGSVLPKLSFYLVNEKTMDQLCPPRKGYNEECLEFLENIEELRNLEKLRYKKYEKYENNYENTIEIIESIYKKLERCKTKDYVAYACYKKPSIYLCPERIKSDKLFPFILIHELVHAYLDTKRKVYNEIIEESIANAIALLHYKNYEVFEFIHTQPAEYKGCYFWITSFNENILLYILDHLRVGKLFPLELESLKSFREILKDPLFFEEFVYLWRKKIIRNLNIPFIYPFYPLTYWFNFLSSEDLIYKSYIYYIEKGDISIFYKALGIYILKYVKNI